MAKRFVSTIILLLLLFNLTALNPQAQAADAASKAGAVTISEGWLNVRSRASSGSPIVSTLKKGSYITLISKSGSWWRVEYTKDSYGYCHADYITIVQGSPATVAVSAGSLNVRSGPGTSYSRTASLSKGTTVLLLTSSNGWSRVLYHGTKTGYVSSRYLSGGSAGQTPAATYPAISLPVPSYKQTDSRWANVTIGSSGKTIAKIGCATTAIAMIESYRTGTNIHPDAMSKQLRYTSGGSVYWPENYTAVTSSSGYLAKIYEQLRQGKPVLFGAKNSYGGQHWVVITGYIGGSALSTAGFTINDPGSSSRTTLQQFLSIYPTFYKYFVY